MPINWATAETYKVESSTIGSIAYDKRSKTMLINFLNGSRYEYNPVSRDLLEDFLKADSQGQFFHKNIRHNSEIGCIKL